MKKKYSASLVSQGFWFYEFKKYIELLNDGETENEIKQLSNESNIFAAVSSSRSREVFNSTRRKVNILDKEIQTLFPTLNIDNQKIICLISVLLLNDLFLEFMLEVFQEKIYRNDLKLTITDYRTFFSEKQRTNVVVSSWKNYTYIRLSSAYKNYLVESGLVIAGSSSAVITPKILDSRVVKWLISINRPDIVKAISGGR